MERVPLSIRASTWDAVWGTVEWSSDARLRGTLSLADALRLRRVSRASGHGMPVTVRPRQLGRRRVPLRPATSDAKVMRETFLGEYHLPLTWFDADVVVDLGANLGLTSAHYAERWPDARVISVEPQPYLAGVAAELLASYGARCTVVQAAIWTEDGTISFSVEPGVEFGGHVVPGGADDRVPAVSLNSLLRECPRVDFLKMDIEGAEASVLRTHTEWTRRVERISVECHGDYTVERCMNDLVRLGYRTTLDSRHIASVFGER